jgi:hypothetical protein
MKILFTGPILDFSGFAHASRNLLLSLICSEETEVVARPLRYDSLDSGKDTVIDPRILKACEEPLTGIEVCIQMTTCNVEANPVPGVLNGLYSFFETDRVPFSWAEKANLFDFLMVSCPDNAGALLRSGVKKPILVCPPPCDASIYRKYEPFNLPNVGPRTVFYNICQLSQKKGIDALIRAYYAAFIDCPNEVALVLKTYIGMSDRSQDEAILRDFVGKIKQGCRLPIEPTAYPPIIPVLGTLSDEEIHGLHTRGDVYVCSSRGEGWGIPVFDALCHGNTVISNAFGGLKSFVSNENSLVYGGCVSNCFEMQHGDPHLYTGIEQWFEPSTAEMAHLMRSYHILRAGNMNKNLNEANEAEWLKVGARTVEGRKLAGRFDYNEVAPKIVKQIEDALRTWKETGSVKFGPPENKEEKVS